MIKARILKVTLDMMESREKFEWWVDDDGAEASIGVDIYREKEKF